ncbi:MAG: SDR family oxidoreductase [Capnocytophaga sp.]|nr:SDR family oxidoreductase [Capnocytophaga sp.]
MKEIVLITGASSGIGKMTAEYLSDKGYIVYGTARNPKEISEKFTLLPMDVREEKSIQNAVNQIIEKEKRIDILINNAGVGISGAMEEIPMEEIQNVFQTNFFGAINVMKLVLPTMRNQRKGLIINVTSIAGYMGLPFRGAYSASKGALELITEAMRMEVKSFGVDMVCIAPGDFATDIASRRYHTPVYENSPYKEAYQKSLKLMNADVNSGQNPTLMAEKIFRIIKINNRKIHYKQASFLQKFSIVLKRILPDKMYEKLLMNHYQLN